MASVSSITRSCSSAGSRSKNWCKIVASVVVMPEQSAPCLLPHSALRPFSCPFIPVSIPLSSASQHGVDLGLLQGLLGQQLLPPPPKPLCPVPVSAASTLSGDRQGLRSYRQPPAAHKPQQVSVLGLTGTTYTPQSRPSTDSTPTSRPKAFRASRLLLRPPPAQHRSPPSVASPSPRVPWPTPPAGAGSPAAALWPWRRRSPSGRGRPGPSGSDAVG